MARYWEDFTHKVLWHWNRGYPLEQAPPASQAHSSLSPGGFVREIGIASELRFQRSNTFW